MNLAALPLLFACVLPPQSAADGGPTRASQTIEQICTSWRAGRISTTAQLDSALAKLGRDATPELCLWLDSAPADVPIRPFAMATAKLGGSSSLPALLRLAGSPRAENRVAGVQALGLVGTDTTLPVLVGALDDAESAVVSAAEKSILTTKSAPAIVANALSLGLASGVDKCRPAMLLARLGTDHAHQALIDHAEARAEGECVAALQGLATAARAEDGTFLIELLQRSESRSVRKQVCLVLGRLKHKPAIDPLIVCLRDPDPGVCANAHWALKQITDLPLKADPALWELWKRRSGDTPPAGVKSSAE